MSYRARRSNTLNDYTYQMSIAIKKHLGECELDLADFSPEQLSQWIWDNKDEIGGIIMENMFEFQSDEDWFKAIKKS